MAKRLKRLHPRVRKSLIEGAATGSERAGRLIHEAWLKAEDLPPIILSAVFRDLVVEIGHVNNALKTLRNDSLEQA